VWVIDPCEGVHRNGAGWGGLFLDDHLAPGWAPLTRSFPGGVDPDLRDAKTLAATNRDGSYSRVRRGGAWTDDGWPCRSAFRLRFEPERRYDHIGFRVVAVRR
jgi:hypothetical protein